MFLLALWRRWNGDERGLVRGVGSRLETLVPTVVLTVAYFLRVVMSKPTAKGDNPTLDERFVKPDGCTCSIGKSGKEFDWEYRLSCPVEPSAHGTYCSAVASTFALSRAASVRGEDAKFFGGVVGVGSVRIID